MESYKVSLVFSHAAKHFIFRNIILIIHLEYRTKSKGHVQVTTNTEGRLDLQRPVNNTCSELYEQKEKHNEQKEKQNTKLFQNFVIHLQKFSLCKKGKFNEKTASYCWFAKLYWYKLKC